MNDSPLVERILSSFKTNIVSSTVLFHESRLITSDFVRLQLMSSAREFGYLVSCMNFRDINEDTARRLVAAWYSDSTNLPVLKRLSFSARAAQTVSKKRDPLDALDALVGAYRATKTKILIILENIDLIAGKTDEETFVYALRGIMEREKDWLHVIFTGSDQKALGTLFLHPQSAFYKSASLISLQQVASSINGASPLITPC